MVDEMTGDGQVDADHTPVVCLAGGAVAEDKRLFHPTKTVTIDVPDGPGGSTDEVGRLMATEHEEMWWHTVFVNSRIGGRNLADTVVVARYG